MVAAAAAAVVAVPLSIAALFQGVKHFAEHEDEVAEDLNSCSD